MVEQRFRKAQVVSSTLTSGSMLAEGPRMGRARSFPDPELADLRSWSVKGFVNFLIFYRPIDNGIEVVRVLHCRKGSPSWKTPSLSRMIEGALVLASRAAHEEDPNRGVG